MEESEDLTIPDHDQMERRAGKAMSDFMSAVYPEGYTSGSAKTGSKRKVQVPEASDVITHKCD